MNVTVKNGTVYLTNTGENPRFHYGSHRQVHRLQHRRNFSLSGPYTTSSMGFTNSTGMAVCGITGI